MAQHSDRFARGTGDDADAAEHLAEVVFWARRAGVELRSCQDDHTFGDLIHAVVMGDRNAQDSAWKAASVKDGLKRRRASGLHSGGAPRYGYVHVRDEYGRTVPSEPLQIVSGQAEVIVRIATEYAQGRGIRTITRSLIEDGIATRDGGAWWPSTVSHLLDNPFYAGYIESGDEQVRGKHEPIISDELWMSPRRTQPKGRQPHELYVCLNRTIARSECGQAPVDRAAVDSAALAYFENVGLSVEQTRAEVARAASRSLVIAQEAERAAERELVQAQEAAAEVERAFTHGDLTAERYSRMMDALDQEVEAARDQHEQQAARVAQLAESTHAPQLQGDLAEHLAALREQIEASTADAESIEAVQIALRHLFPQFTLYTSTRTGRTR